MTSGLPFDILCEDGPLLAVNKPAGLPTQAPPGIPSLEAAVKAHLKERFAKPGNVYLGVPHRLDRPVSGLVVFARNSKAAARLAEQFAERRVKKTYRAIVEGHWPDDAGTLTDFLKKIPGEPRAAIANADDAEAREAALSYHVIARALLAELSLPATVLEIELQTGRMHQIRVQFASRGCPIIGDVFYGARTEWNDEASRWNCRSAPASASAPRAATPPMTDERRSSADRIALHAAELTLDHPIRYDRVALKAPLPSFWQSLVLTPELRPTT